jgi:hypothetical protein
MLAPSFLRVEIFLADFSCIESKEITFKDLRLLDHSYSNGLRPVLHFFNFIGNAIIAVKAKEAMVGDVRTVKENFYLFIRFNEAIILFLIKKFNGSFVHRSPYCISLGPVGFKCDT